jgi:hypothetical protein
MIKTTIPDDWRCDALEPRGDPDTHRCESGGMRFLGPHWVCFRHFDEAAARYVCGDRNESRKPRAW